MRPEWRYTAGRREQAPSPVPALRFSWHNERMRRVLLPLLALLLGLAGWSMEAHPLAWRFAIGTWPVPQGTPWTYQFLSGFFASMAVLSLLGAVVSFYHLHNCHADRCWRIGKHKIGGTPWCGSHKHMGKPHPDVIGLLERIVELLEARNAPA